MRSAVVLAGLVFGCHGGGHSTSIDAAEDAPPADAAHDGVAAPLPITVTVYGDGVFTQAGTPVQNMATYFIAPNGSAQKVLTDINGVASAPSPAGTTLLVARPNGSSFWELNAYAALQPGDSLVNGIEHPQPIYDTVAGSVTFQIPSAYPGATYYWVSVSCSSGSQSPSGSMPTSIIDCPDKTNASAVAVALTSSSVPLAYQPPLAYTSLTGLDLTTMFNTTVTMPAWQSVSTVTGVFTNLPTTTSSIELFTGYQRGTDPTYLGNGYATATPSGGSASTSAGIAPVGDHSVISVRADQNSNYSPISYLAPSAQLVTNVQIDGSTMIHPAMNAAYDEASRTLSWMEASDGVAADVVTAGLSWQTNAGISIHYLWFAPHGTSPSIVWPGLPQDLSQLMYPAGVWHFNGAQLTTYVGKTYGDFVNNRISGAAVWSTPL